MTDELKIEKDLEGVVTAYYDAYRDWKKKQQELQLVHLVSWLWFMCNHYINLHGFVFLGGWLVGNQQDRILYSDAVRCEDYTASVVGE
jgi:hypothetical protein